MTYHNILEQLLPAGIQIPTGFETVGHIIHFNLRPEHTPYKYLIGQVLLDKVINAKTIVNKLEKLNNVYRTPELELLAGEPKYETELHEGGCTFKLDF